MAWTKEEDDFLIANREKAVPWLAKQLGRCVSNIVKARRRLGLSELKTHVDWERVEPLIREKYEAGWMDTEISSHAGVSKGVVFLWRKKRGLPANGPPGHRATNEWTEQDDAFLRANHEEGPKWLVRHMNRSRSAILRAQKRLGLGNVRDRIDWEKLNPVLMAKYKEGWKDPDIAEFAGISWSSVFAWRKRNNLPANTPKRRKKNPVKVPDGETVPWSPSPTAPDYSDEQKVWLKAIDSFRGKHRRPPTYLEAFRLARSLGYTKEESNAVSGQTDS